uniref:Uncharacterized protein n=1 Tax=Anguilla anguilla TaxID=7936 RepID=A0A0E9SW13_ANGAN
MSARERMHAVSHPFQKLAALDSHLCSKIQVSS